MSFLNLDNESANDFTNKSVEDIKEVQGVELPQRSKRFNDMMAVAKRYYAMLNNARKALPGQLENLKQQLDEFLRRSAMIPHISRFFKCSDWLPALIRRNRNATCSTRRRPDD